MRRLERGTYLGRVNQLSESEGILAGSTSYYQDDGTSLPHFHDNPHLSFLLRGAGIVKTQYAEVEKFPGDILFFAAGEAHQCLDKEFPARRVNLEVDLKFLDEHFMSESGLRESALMSSRTKFSMLKVYRELLAADCFSQDSIKMLVLDLASDGSDRVVKMPRWGGVVRDLMNDRWNTQLTLKELSAVAGVHPVTVSKFFPRYFSCTFGEYMRRLRIERSLRMVQVPGACLTSIALECGFYDQSHFIRTFKDLTGFVPSSYAKL